MIRIKLEHEIKLVSRPPSGRKLLSPVAASPDQRGLLYPQQRMNLDNNKQDKKSQDDFNKPA